ncbi:MAG TPA: hypothetical protein VF230_15045, partial [Acidimicrobiales bacterium]
MSRSGARAKKIIGATASATALVMALSAVGGQAGAAPRGFVRVASHAAAAAQPTSTGRAIADLQVWDGKVYMGYGDYGANTGPITVSSFEPRRGVVSDEFVQDTEAVYNYRAIGNRLIAPSIDPRVAADYAAGGPWAEASVAGASHVFDVATLTGTDLWMVGSKDMDAVAWRSLDGGTTWAEVLRVAPRTTGDHARFYFAGVLNGRLYVHATDAGTGAHPASNVFDGASWSEGPALISGYTRGWRPVEFNGELVYTANPQNTGRVHAFDGSASRIIGMGRDIEVTPRKLYLLDSWG